MQCNLQYLDFITLAHLGRLKIEIYNHAARLDVSVGRDQINTDLWKQMVLKFLD